MGTAARPATQVETAVTANDVTITTTSLAAKAGRRRGTAAKVDRAMPVVNSELIRSTPRDPRISWAKAMPDVGTLTARSPPWAAILAAACGSRLAASANWPVPHAERAPKPTMTTAVEASRISVESRLRNLITSELRTRTKVGPGRDRPALRAACPAGEGAGSRAGMDSVVVELMGGLPPQRAGSGIRRRPWSVPYTLPQGWQQ